MATVISKEEAQRATVANTIAAAKENKAKAAMFFAMRNIVEETAATMIALGISSEEVAEFIAMSMLAVTGFMTGMNGRLLESLSLNEVHFFEAIARRDLAEKKITEDDITRLFKGEKEDE